ncbi:hypothetical protein Sjap_011269 [Stephania japonica]|uniref:Uncharacterized protein n=1 Tax=Stephania japonica TaxID=461633 RepID=A0AAP0JAT6_9MAGN
MTVRYKLRTVLDSQHMWVMRVECDIVDLRLKNANLVSRLTSHRLGELNSVTKSLGSSWLRRDWRRFHFRICASSSSATVAMPGGIKATSLDGQEASVITDYIIKPLQDAGAIVPTSYEAFEDAIKEAFEKLVTQVLLTLLFSISELGMLSGVLGTGIGLVCLLTKTDDLSKPLR